MTADCGWSTQVSAWIDANSNGMRDAGELPLPGVNFFFNNANGSSQYRRGPSVSNSKGETRLYEFMPGCPIVTFEIYPEAPAGYQLTTAPRQTSRGPGDGDSFSFGFAALPGAVTTTPRHASLTCAAHKLLDANADQFLSDLTVAPDGSVWVSLFGKGAAHYLPAQNQWITYSTADGLVGNEVRRVMVSNDGVIWLATTAGASRFDGRRWSSYTTANGLVHDNIRQVAQAKDGSLWFATRSGVSHFEPVQNRWQNYMARDGLAYDFTTNVAISGDGSVWFPTVGKGISRLVPSTPPVWRSYTQNPTGDRYPKVDTIDDIKTAGDGSLWIGSLGGVLHYEPSLDRWTNYPIRLATSGYDEFAKTVAVAADGSLWIGTAAFPPQLYHVIRAHDGQPDDWVLYDTRDGLPKSSVANDRDDTIRAIAIASDGVMWVGTTEFATRCELT
jgi:ligand-binding sensor domain-containing protein